MRIVLVEPQKKAVIRNIDGTPETMQCIVGGPIQAVYPFSEPVALICNDEGKLMNLPMNRALRDADGAVYDIVNGTFFLCAAPPDSSCFEGLSNEQARTYAERFSVPEIFLNVGEALLILPLL